jgi:TonB family protein
MSIIDNIDLAEWVLNAAFQALMILGIGVLILYSIRHKAAPLRSGISLVTMLALVMLPFFSTSLNELGYMPLRTALPLTIDKTPSPSMTVSYDLSEVQVDMGNSGSAGYSRQHRTGTVIVKFIDVFGLIWGIGFLFMLCRLALGALAIHNLKRGMVEVRTPRILAILSSVEKMFGRGFDVRVFVSPRVPYPMAAGIFKPAILIPDHSLDKWQDSQIQGILLHELSHIHHRDLATGVLQRLVTALNWWNPLAYVLSTYHSRAREEISDNHVLLQNDSKEYAECLIELAEKTTLWKRLSVSVGLASPHIPLKDRVKHILSKERIMDTNLKKSTITVMVVTAFMLLIAITGSRLIFATAEPEVAAVTTGRENPELANRGTQEKDKKGREVIPSKLIRKVEPVYPDEAKEADIEGTVTLEATTDNFGRVQNVKVLKSVPELDQAAVDAVKKWVYEPMIINGKPFGVTFTVTCRFSLKDKQAKSFEGGVTEEGEKPPFLAMGDIKPPKLIKKVEPVYPDEAKEAEIEGVVILEATTDVYGRVVKTKILRSIPELDQAAIDAVKQWVYEPMIIHGEPRGIIFTVTCNFRLDDKK